jgi:hypothetical protein
MANLTAPQKQELTELINKGIAANLARWNVEREIERIVGGEIREFVDFWGGYCAPMGDEPWPLPPEEMEGAIESLQNQAKP